MPAIGNRQVTAFRKHSRKFRDVKLSRPAQERAPPNPAAPNPAKDGAFLAIGPKAPASAAAAADQTRDTTAVTCMTWGSFKTLAVK
jgi:hypothetical protein